MAMNESVPLDLALVLGLGLGVMFFGGLWWTIYKASSSPRPARWFLLSLLIRTGLTLFGFYFISAGHWTSLLACLLGFIVARLAMTSFAREAPRAP